MRSAKLGNTTSAVEVTNVSPHGFWLLVAGEEKFVPFARFPWFASASIAALCDVKMLSKEHLHWPLLDIDLAIDSIDHPENYPLVSRVAERLDTIDQYTAASRRTGQKTRSRTKRARPPAR